MTALELLKQSKLQEALETLQLDIKRNPADVQLRLGLFQLLAVSGRWERALAQLQTAVSFDADLVPWAVMLRSLAELEQVRAAMFKGDRTPSVLGPKPDWLSKMHPSIQCEQGENAFKAEADFEEAMDMAPARTGKVNGKPFAWIADADSRLGPVMEGYLSGNYYWIPMETLKQVVVTSPTQVLDLIWLQAEFTLARGEVLAGYIPTRYPESERSTDGQVVMARTAVWTTLGKRLQIGSGVRVLSTDCDDIPITKIQKIEFN
ncbi:MAG: virulence protein SciE type [Verrucomicrobia bacterium]|nr:virulence protein SciE type [Verrucomicrobiota bacterium]